jgi:replicative DNA helicase
MVDRAKAERVVVATLAAARRSPADFLLTREHFTDPAAIRVIGALIESPGLSDPEIGLKANVDIAAWAAYVAPAEALQSIVDEFRPVAARTVMETGLGALCGGVDLSSVTPEQLAEIAATGQAAASAGAVEMDSVWLGVLESLSDRKLVTTGIPSLDAEGGIPPGYVGIGAAPGAGKTLIGTLLALHFLSEGIPTVFKTDEQSAVDIGERAVQTVARVTKAELETWRNRSPETLPQVIDRIDTSLGEAAMKLREMDLHVLEKKDAPSIEALIGYVDALEQETGTQPAVVIDYLQKMVPESQNMKQDLNRISRKIEAWCLERRERTSNPAPVIVLAQLLVGRDGGQTQFSPQNAVLKESNGPEEHSDALLIIWRETEGDETSREIKLYCKKSRGGVRLGLYQPIIQATGGLFLEGNVPEGPITVSVPDPVYAAPEVTEPLSVAASTAPAQTEDIYEEPF